jgi:hypothetical protein
MEVSGQLQAPAPLPPGKPPCIHWIGGWVGLKAGLDGVEGNISCPRQELNPGRLASSLSLHQLSYPGFYLTESVFFTIGEKPG